MAASARQVRDQWIALGCRTGDPKAFEALVADFQRPLLYYAARLLRDDSAALDVLQEVWLAALRSVRSLNDPNALRPWLYRLTHGRAVDRIRHERFIQRAEQARALESPEAADDQADLTDADATAIHRALDELSLEHREVLVLHVLDELPIAAIASVVCIPEGTVKSRLHHARRSLKSILTRTPEGKVYP